MRRIGRQAVKNSVSAMLARAGLPEKLDRLGRRRGGVILAYHHITKERLDAQLQALSSYLTFASLAEIVERLAAGASTAGLAAITFDDGFADVAEWAAAMGAERGWPMTFYLPTRAVDTGEHIWSVEIRSLVSMAIGKRIMVGGKSVWIKDQHHVGKAVHKLSDVFYRASSPDEVDALRNELRRSVLSQNAGVAEAPLLTPITWQTVEQLARQDGVTFGSHSVNHLAFSRLSPGEIAHELDASRTRIEEHTEAPVRHFCYPYGRLEDIGAIAPELVRRSWGSAVTLVRGRCHTTADLMLLPRIALWNHETPELALSKVALAR